MSQQFSGDSRAPAQQADKFHPNAMLHQRPSGSNANILLTAGKTLMDKLARTFFRDWNDMRDMIMFMRWCEKHNVSLETAEYFLAGSPAIGGLARREFSQVAAGIIAPQLWGEKGDGKRFGKRATEPTEPPES